MTTKSQTTRSTRPARTNHGTISTRAPKELDSTTKTTRSTRRPQPTKSTRRERVTGQSPEEIEKEAIIRAKRDERQRKKEAILEQKELDRLDNRPSRADALSYKRYLALTIAPMKFLLALFFTVCVVVFAFNMLQGNDHNIFISDLPTHTESGEEIIYRQNPAKTSANTSILRQRE